MYVLHYTRPNHRSYYNIEFILGPPARTRGDPGQYVRAHRADALL